MTNMTLSALSPYVTRLALWLGLLLTGALAATAQQPQPTPVAADEVIRVSTELVQTDVVVFDKDGRFVDNLRADDFLLRVDGKPQTISFFERVKAGTVNEEAQLAAARGGRAVDTPADGSAAVRPLDRGRQLLFFVDDLHLSTASLARTRKLLTSFVDQQLTQNDQVAIITASGQVGFLQQLTDDRDVLRAAIGRLAYRERAVRDNDHPLMTPIDAYSIRRNDQTVIDAFVEALLNENPLIRRDQAENQVRTRADLLLQLSDHVATETFDSLRQLVRLSAQLPGRKLIYFISDGFLLNDADSIMLDRMRRLTDAALRAGVVIYTLDAHGLSTGTLDLSETGLDNLPDRTGQVRLNSANPLFLQEPLRAIAADTGGRALLNTNALANALKKALDETSVYYLLAWRPAQEELRGGKFRRIEVTVKQRPELTVLVQRGFFNTPVDEAATREPGKRQHPKEKETDANAQAAKAAATPLIAALNAFAPKTALPTALTLNYLYAPDGLLLASSLRVKLDALTPGPSRQIDIAGLVFDEQGQLVSSFQRRASLLPRPDAPPATTYHTTDNAPPHLDMTFQTPIKPGLYQVRVAASDLASGRTGSAVEWLTIPAIDNGKLTLSSIFIGAHARTAEPAAQAAQEQGQPFLDPARRFPRNSVLRLALYVYNAAPAAQTNVPDVALQLQIFRDDQPVITTPLHKISTDGLKDYRILPYGGELDLSNLPSGRYVLHITGIDRVAKTSASQRVKFTIE